MARVAWQPRCAARHILPQIARRYREYSGKLGRIEPQKTKNDIIRTNRKLFKPDAPNRLWETYMTYVWCGMDGWCYCFNVADCFTRRWISYAFDVDATKQVAIDSITNAVSVENPDCSRLRLRTDNGTQYTRNDFRKAVSVFGIKHEFIWKHTPEQNGHVESSHKTLKKRILVAAWICQLSRGRKAPGRCLCRLQPRKNSLCHRIHDACRICITVRDEE